MHLLPPDLLRALGCREMWHVRSRSSPISYEVMRR